MELGQELQGDPLRRVLLVHQQTADDGKGTVVALPLRRTAPTITPALMICPDNPEMLMLPPSWVSSARLQG